MAPKRKDSKVANGLMALSSAAVLAVYTAGYVRTRSAAQRFASDPAPRRSAAQVDAAISASPSARPQPADVKPTSESKPARITSLPAPPSAKSASPRRTSAASAPRPAAVPDIAPKPVVEGLPALPAAASPVVTATSPAVPEHDARAAEPPLAPPVAARVQYKDGTYSGWGTSRHGDIQATVVVEGGRIASAVISQCLTRYSCSWIAALPPQVVSRQSPEVDFVSGATQSTNAFYDAVVEALAKTK